jgi:signal transduction histidine kinase
MAYILTADTAVRHYIDSVSETVRRIPGLETRLLEAILEQLPLGVIVADAGSGEVVAASAQAHDYADLSDPGAPLLNARRVNGSAVSAAAQPLARALAGAHIRNELYEVDCTDGRVRLLQVSASPIVDEEGHAVAAVALLGDVSDRARQLRVEREFVANAAHELRTPIAAILSATEVLQAGAKELAPERDLFLGHIEREAARLTRIARAVLMVARAQSSGEEVPLEIVPLRPLLESVSAAVTPGSSVAMTVSCDSAIAALVNSDLLEQALINLAANAARYTEAGTIELTAVADRDRVCIDVRDTGPGIPQDVMRNAFDRFHRGRSAPEGWGLGLAITRQAVEVTGGSLEVKTDGAGTTARIGLPLARMVEP